MPWANTILSIPFKKPTSQSIGGSILHAKCTKCALFSCQLGEGSPPPLLGSLGITEAWHFDKQSGSCGWVVLFASMMCLLGALHCLVVQKERVYAKTSLRSMKQREDHMSWRKEMHRDSSANETVSLPLAHTGSNPIWHGAAIGLPKVLLNVVHFGLP